MISSQNNVRKYHTKGHEQVFYQYNLKLTKYVNTYSGIYPELETPQPIIISTVKVQWNGKSSTSSLDLTSFFSPAFTFGLESRSTRPSLGII